MLGTLIALLLFVVILGVVWWAIMKIWPIIAQYIEEPFRTIAYVILVLILVVIVLVVIVQLLGMAGIHVPSWGGLR